MHTHTHSEFVGGCGGQAGGGGGVVVAVATVAASVTVAAAAAAAAAMAPVVAVAVAAMVTAAAAIAVVCGGSLRAAMCVDGGEGDRSGGEIKGQEERGEERCGITGRRLSTPPFRKFPDLLLKHKQGGVSCRGGVGTGVVQGALDDGDICSCCRQRLLALHGRWPHECRAD